ncbi:MAG: Clp protease ClpP [Oscillospiraceae bacterium]|nr:Clp protease ClpP [Oscillospiraceae bacterium]
MNKHFWSWSNDGGERILHLNGTIAEESWFEDDVTPEMFREELMGGSGPITIWLNSPGGDCVAASRIYSMLMDYPGDVTVKIDGIAASAASVIAMAGTTVLMAPTSMIMVHNPATMAFGDHNELERAIGLLETVKESIINAYEIKTSLDRKTLSKLMEEETWMDCNKAMELGFADGVLQRETGSPAVSNGILFSQKRTDAALVNRLTEKAGMPIQPYYDRLEKLR